MPYEKVPARCSWCDARGRWDFERLLVRCGCPPTTRKQIVPRRKRAKKGGA